MVRRPGRCRASPGLSRVPALVRLLVVFARYPEPGSAKTRLIPRLGAEGAAALQRAMAEHAMRRVDGASDALEVRFEGGDAEGMRRWLGDRARYRPQGGGDLGERMLRALEEGFASGARAAVLVGTDVPGIDARDVQAAFLALEGSDVVFGPAADGGYWLVGARRIAGARLGCLFRGMAWGGPAVLAASLRAAAAAGLAATLLRTLHDVDRPEDLEAWEREGQGPCSRSSSRR